jgi:hypothetical protein
MSYREIQVFVEKTRLELGLIGGFLTKAPIFKTL